MSTAKEVTAKHLQDATDRATAASKEAERFGAQYKSFPDARNRRLLHEAEQVLRVANQEVEELERSLRRLEDEESERNALLEAERHRGRQEERAFWFRRFHTSLALAHGAGFAAVASKLFDATVTSATAAGAWYPMAAFAVGMLLAGLIPVALFRENQRIAWALAIGSATLFVIALGAALAAVWIKADLVLPGG